MSTLQASKSVQVAITPVSTRFPWWRTFVLLVLLLLSIALYIGLMNVVPPPNEFVGSSNIRGMVGIWMSNFLPYFGACALILIAKPTIGRWYRLELGIIFAGALILHVMLFPVLPVLSHDSWRYLWDARVLLHGYSPYVFAPDSRVLAPLRDNYVYPLTGFHLVPTIYPPGAQAIYLLSYLLAPNNIYVLKTIFLCFDMATCGTLALLLKQRGLDPRRVIIYAWCPLPIVEFAIQAHVDVVTITFMVLALLCASSDRRGMRALTGFLIAMATLTKLYPILLLLVVLRRRELTFKQPALLLSCFGTILLGYLPFLILGHGQVLGFFLTYSQQQTQNGGIIQKIVYWFSHQLLNLPHQSSLLLESIVDVIVIGAVCLFVLLLRQRERISMEAAALLLISTVFAISSHVFPWYVSALLPWIAMMIGPIWMGKRLSGKRLAVITAWYFTWTVLIGYFYLDIVDWDIFYLLVYDMVVAGVVVAAIAGLINIWRMQTISG